MFYEIFDKLPNVNMINCLITRVAVGMEFQYPSPSHSHRISVGIPTKTHRTHRKPPKKHRNPQENGLCLICGTGRDRPGKSRYLIPGRDGIQSRKLGTFSVPSRRLGILTRPFPEIRYLMVPSRPGN